MKSNTFSLIVIAISSALLTACTQVQVAKQEATESQTPSSISFIVNNSADHDFIDTPLVLTRTELYALGITPTITDIRLFADGIEVASQLDDLDQDGQFDELAFLIDIPAGAERVVFVQTNEMETGFKEQGYETRTNIQFAKFVSATQQSDVVSLTEASRRAEGLSADYSRQYQMEGPGWENDKIGFRLYFDERNGFDIFGKTQRTMVLDKVGINENYHELQDWGMDILKVGRSLGAGALAFVNDNPSQPSLERLSNAFKTEVQIVSEGPVRSIFDIYYQQLPLQNTKPTAPDMRQRISIWAGQHYYTSRLLVSKIEAPITVAVGVVNFYELTAVNTIHNNKAILASFGVQAEEATQLGMAVVGESNQHTGFGSVGATESGVEHSLYSRFTLSPDAQLEYKFYAVWQPRMLNIDSKTAFVDLIDIDILREQAVSITLP